MPKKRQETACAIVNDLACKRAVSIQGSGPRIIKSILSHPCVGGTASSLEFTAGGGDALKPHTPVLICELNCIQAMDAARKGKILILDYFTGANLAEERGVLACGRAFSHQVFPKVNPFLARTMVQLAEDPSKVRSIRASITASEEEDLRCLIGQFMYKCGQVDNASRIMRSIPEAPPQITNQVVVALDDSADLSDADDVWDDEQTV